MCHLKNSELIQCAYFFPSRERWFYYQLHTSQELGQRSILQTTELNTDSLQSYRLDVEVTNTISKKRLVITFADDLESTLVQTKFLSNNAAEIIYYAQKTSKVIPVLMSSKNMKCVSSHLALLIAKPFSLAFFSSHEKGLETIQKCLSVCGWALRYW